MENKSVKYDIKKLAEELEFDIEDISILFSKYFIEAKDNMLQMENYLAKRNWSMLERVVHNIKGVSVNLNILDVHEAAAHFDALLKDNNTDNADAYVQKLVELLKNSEVELRKIFAEMNMEV